MRNFQKKKLKSKKVGWAAEIFQTRQPVDYQSQDCGPDLDTKFMLLDFFGQRDLDVLKMIYTTVLFF